MGTKNNNVKIVKVGRMKGNSGCLTLFLVLFNVLVLYNEFMGHLSCIVKVHQKNSHNRRS
jgi:hypothetical protein